MLQEHHTREDDTVVLRMLERVRVPRRNHAGSNKVGTTTRNACAVWRTKPTARAGIIDAMRRADSCGTLKFPIPPPTVRPSLGAARSAAHSGRPVGASVFGFKDDDDARRFGFVGLQTRQSRITPAGKTDNFTSLNFHFWRFSGLQDVKTAAIEKERVIPKQVVQLGNRGMAIGKNLGVELAQGLFHLYRVQLHRLLLFAFSRSGCAPGRKSLLSTSPGLLASGELLPQGNVPGRLEKISAHGSARRDIARS